LRIEKLNPKCSCYKFLLNLCIVSQEHPHWLINPLSFKAGRSMSCKGQSKWGLHMQWQKIDT
jgi:hypothetical protein